MKNEVEATKFKHKLKKVVREYMEYGSFPKVSLLQEGKEELLTTYFQDILIKDVQRRFKIRKTEKLEELAKYYLIHISTLQSFNKTRKVMNLSLDTLERFSQYFSIARLIFFLPKFSFSLKKQILNPKKVYCADPGLRNVVSFKFTEDLGRIAENIVFLNLFRENKDLYYWRDYSGKEVDFVVREKSNLEKLIQVCWRVEDKKTKERETSSLVKAMDKFNVREGLIITEDLEAQEKVNKNKKIIYKPLWKWLLSF